MISCAKFNKQKPLNKFQQSEMVSHAEVLLQVLSVVHADFVGRGRHVDARHWFSWWDGTLGQGDCERLQNTREEEKQLHLRQQFSQTTSGSCVKRYICQNKMQDKSQPNKYKQKQSDAREKLTNSKRNESVGFVDTTISEETIWVKLHRIWPVLFGGVHAPSVYKHPRVLGYIVAVQLKMQNKCHFRPLASLSHFTLGLSSNETRTDWQQNLRSKETKPQIVADENQISNKGIYLWSAIEIN